MLTIGIYHFLNDKILNIALCVIVNIVADTSVKPRLSVCNSNVVAFVFALISLRLVMK